MVEHLRPSEGGVMPGRLSDETLGIMLKEIGKDERRAIKFLRKQANINNVNIEVPFAGLMLSFSERHPNTSLNQFFESPKNGTPFPRYKMLREILALTLPARRDDLANVLDKEGKLLTEPLRELNRNKIVTYKSREHNGPYSLYKLSSEVPKNPPDFSSYRIVSQQVYDTVLADPQKSWTIEQIVDILYEQQQGQWQKKSLMVGVSNILSYLANNEYLKREGFSKHNQSEITLSEEQREVLNDLVKTITRFQNLDSEVLEDGKTKANEIIQDPKRVLALMSKKREIVLFNIT